MPSYSNDLPLLPPFLTHMRALQVGAIKLHLMATDEARDGLHNPTNVGFCIVALFQKKKKSYKIASVDSSSQQRLFGRWVGFRITLVKYDNMGFIFTKMKINTDTEMMT